MARQIIDATNNEHADVAASKHNQNFADLYGTSGTFTANGATAVVVAAPKVTANSQIQMTLKTVGGTPAGAPFLSAITPGTGFQVKSVAGDTSVYNYTIIL